MTKSIEDLARLASDLADLNGTHAQFMEGTPKFASRSFKLGTFAADGKAISATVLGVPIRARHRPIYDEECFTAIEYAFVSEIDGEEVVLWRMFLDRHGSLFQDAALTKRLSDFDNEYLPRTIVTYLANALLSSKVFRPA